MSDKAQPITSTSPGTHLGRSEILALHFLQGFGSTAQNDKLRGLAMAIAEKAGVISGNMTSGGRVVPYGFLPGPHIVHAQETEAVIVEHRLGGPAGFLWVLV